MPRLLSQRCCVLGMDGHSHQTRISWGQQGQHGATVLGDGEALNDLHLHLNAWSDSLLVLRPFHLGTFGSPAAGWARVLLAALITASPPDISVASWGQHWCAGKGEEHCESVNLLPGVTSDLWPASNMAIDLLCFPQHTCQRVIKPMGIPVC